MDKSTISEALVQLIHCGAVKIRPVKEVTFKFEEDDKLAFDDGILLYVNVHHIFDYECSWFYLRHSKIESLWESVKDPTYKGHGHYRWLAIELNNKPLKSLVKQMKEAGVWDEVLEALPNNIHETTVIKSLH